MSSNAALVQSHQVKVEFIGIACPSKPGARPWIQRLADGAKVASPPDFWVGWPIGRINHQRISARRTLVNYLSLTFLAFSFSRRYRFALLMAIYTYPSAIHLGAKFDFHWALPLFSGVPVRGLAGRTDSRRPRFTGIPCLAALQVFVQFDYVHVLTLGMRIRKVVAHGQSPACASANKKTT